MKKILIFTGNLLACIGIANGAIRDGTAVSRTKSEKNIVQTQSRTATTPRRATTPRTTTLAPRQTVATERTAVKKSARTTNSRPSAKPMTVIPRAASDSDFSMSSTRTGAEYEQCKNTYFSCMDQFCSLKNDQYRRCSCNDRVFALTEKRNTLTDAGEQLNVFTENLEVVGMTAAQASAMRNETEGESALTNDNSASKALLQAIMNSISGKDSNVGGKYSDLNSINISFDTVNAFGMTDSGQAIAAYNGNALYSAVYPQCREAVRKDCNNASLQRAVTAYLMAIEQDCNTVQTAIENTQKQMKAAVREGSAMLDLARVENRKKHNSSDITTCINEVETAILSEQVCGANYHKCLDNGEFIDISTGKPIIGVEDFYKLASLLQFSEGVEAADQKLSQNQKNRPFVTNFEKRVKQFAADALDKCVENADTVWAEYLDKAMLAIYYAQQDKVAEIKQGCFEYISACYASGDTAITSALSEISKENAIVLQPDKIALNQRLCTDYIKSCDGMFDNNIIQEYVDNMKQTDLETACRAVVKQCFDRYGGTNYENFFYPYSGLFNTGEALDWFTLYEYKDGTLDTSTYKSECAQQLSKIPACNDPKLIEDVFGGFNLKNTNYGIYVNEKFENGKPRSRGVATEVYNQIVSILTTQCTNMQGRFLEKHWINKNTYNPDTPCLMATPNENMQKHYFIAPNEDMCPRDYALSVDTKSWGACLCWENGARRSKWGKSAKCVPALPVSTAANDGICSSQETNIISCIKDDKNITKCSYTDKENQTVAVDKNFPETHWCTQKTTTLSNQVCPLKSERSSTLKECLICQSNTATLSVDKDTGNGTCQEASGAPEDAISLSGIPEGIK
ncbi:MAG: hypothetical protein Q4C08_02740 [Pseudomonadota bacterium]|nr:hypothetical protein [Pseudomonadota bacterium]